MVQMDLTHVNVLTKIDNLHKFPPLPFKLDFYTQAHDLADLLPELENESPMFGQGKFQALNEAVVELIDEFSLVGYETLAVEDKKSMMALLLAIDRAGGYAFGGAEGANDSVWQVAVRQGIGEMNIQDIQERWIDSKDEYDELEKKEWEEEQKRREADFNNNQPGTTHLDDDEMDTSVPPSSGIKVRRSGKS